MNKNIKLDFDVIVIGIQFLVFVLLILFVFPHTSDDKLMRQIKKHGIKYEFSRSIMWVENDYMDEKAVKEMGALIDKGIKDIEAYTNIPYDRSRYSSEKICYYVKSGRFSSHISEGNILRRKPNLILATSLMKTAPYLVLTAKLIAWNCNTYWLKEGLALYLNEKLNGWPVWPNFGLKADKKALEYFSEGSPVKYFALELYKKIGENALPQLEYGEYELFVVLSASFVGYLDENLGTDQLMAIYKAEDPKQTLFRLSGKNMDKWKDDWLKHISSVYTL